MFGLDGMGVSLIVLGILAVMVLFAGAKTVPQGCNYTVQRFGKYTRTLQPGLNLIVPFVDGRDKIDAGCDCQAVISGDPLSVSIAAASIVAKVPRDRLMTQLGAAHPGYGFERHMGYSVPEHFAALARLGPTIHHRRSFAPVAEALSLVVPVTEASAAPVLAL